MSVGKNMVKEVGGTRKDMLYLPVESLYINPKFDMPSRHTDVEELALSIGQTGFHQNEPIFVRPNKDQQKFEVIDGRGRTLATKLAKEKYNGNGMVYAVSAPVTMTDEELLFETIKSNNDLRKPFKPAEEGAYFLMLKNDMNIKEEEIAKRIGKSITYVQDRICFASLDDNTSNELNTYIDKGFLSVTAASRIAKISDKKERDDAWKEIKENHSKAVQANSEIVQDDSKNASKHPKKIKVKVKDVVRAKKGQTEHLSIKNVKANLAKCEEMYEQTKSDYWENGVKVCKAILANKIID